MNPLEHIKHHLFLLDGGMGTLLQAKGLKPGERPETWCLTHPEEVTAIHRAYFDAGCNAVNTNTFGANLLHFSEEELRKIIPAAVDCAKKARETSLGTQPKFIALDIGPCGRLLKPFGDYDFEEAVALFAKTVEIGEKCGVDFIQIETVNDTYETKAALLAAKEHSLLPVFVTNAYGGDGKLLTGGTTEALCAMLEGMGADAIGMNCSVGPYQLLETAEKLLKVASVPVIFKPNAGMPRETDGRTEYDITPKQFAEAVSEAVDRGVRIVGGCCGTTPEHLALCAKAIAGKEPKEILPKHLTVVSSYANAVDFASAPLLIGERINPTGKKRFKQALTEHDLDYILSEGVKQEECGVHLLDVNVGLPGIDEPALLSELIAELQAITPLPLQIDSSDPKAIEKALRLYCGKALINSVSGKKETTDAIFPLMKKYGGTAVALTLDENGIPDTAEGRLKIAETILERAKEAGIPKEDIIFDPLTLSLASDRSAARVTLDAVRLITEKLGAHTVLGVSNVSFGLPDRAHLNAAFFSLALENGLSAAIMNPYSEEMLRAYSSFRALNGQDEGCAGYLAYCAKNEPSSVPASAPGEPSSLRDSIVKGLKGLAEKQTEALLKTSSPDSVLAEEILPALDFVGKEYEAGRIYLPGLLLSAESAKAAFEKIRLSAGKGENEDGFPFVLATVKGDIHDIGKNIVRLLLGNFGFRVIDLGKDVAPETVLNAVKKENTRLVGLSALMTTTVPAMEETIALLHSSVPGCRIVVGGAVLTEEYAAKIGADRYARDAMETVRFAEEVRDETERKDK